MGSNSSSPHGPELENGLSSGFPRTKSDVSFDRTSTPMTTREATIDTASTATHLLIERTVVTASPSGAGALRLVVLIPCSGLAVAAASGQFRESSSSKAEVPNLQDKPVGGFPHFFMPDRRRRTPYQPLSWSRPVSPIV